MYSLFLSFGRSSARWISSITIPTISFAALKLNSFAFAVHDFRNLDFWPALGRASGVEPPEIDGDNVPEELTAVPDPDAVNAPLAALESNESERGVVARFGNIFGMLKPGEGGFDACGVFVIAAGVGVTGVSGAAWRGDGCWMSALDEKS